jgi:tetratricopeptide (TPR) repeat protein
MAITRRALAFRQNFVKDSWYISPEFSINSIIQPEYVRSNLVQFNALANLRQGHHLEVRLALQKQIARDKFKFASLELLALSYELAGDAKQALRLYDKAADVSSWYYETFLSSHAADLREAIAFFSFEKEQTSLSDYVKGRAWAQLAGPGENLTTWGMRSGVRERTSGIMFAVDNAIERFSRVITRRPDFLPAYILRSDMYRRKGLLNEARADLQEVLKREPEHRKAQASLLSLENQSRKTLKKTN